MKSLALQAVTALVLAYGELRTRLLYPYQVVIHYTYLIHTATGLESRIFYTTNGDSPSGASGIDYTMSFQLNAFV